VFGKLSALGKLWKALVAPLQTPVRGAQYFARKLKKFLRFFTSNY